MGFCFFNNVAIAARHALDVRGLERVAIVDFDVHHGNGTEDIIAGDERVLMVSIFQDPLYPFSGGVPKGTNMVNVPVPAYTRGPEVRELIEANWMPRLEAFRPQMIFISAGFDAHREDDLGQLGLVEADYEWITRRIKGVADRHAQGASSRASKAATTSVRWRAASPRTCACWPASEARPVARSLDPRDELDDLLRSLVQPAALTELAVLAGCLVVAWVVVRVVRGRLVPTASVWFGDRIVDGVLFPILALAFAFGARLALEGTLKPAVFKLAVPMLISLVVIRLSVRVLGVTFPEARWVRVVERSISWLAWIAVVLWVTGISPLMLDAMDDVRWKVGAASITPAQRRRRHAHRRRRAGARAVGLGGDREASCCTAPATRCRSARWPRTSCARCCCSSACWSR